MLRRWIRSTAVLGISLWACAVAEADWFNDSGERWCFAHSSKTICLSEDYEMERVALSAIELIYRRDVLPSVFATFFDRVRSPDDEDPFPDTLMKLRSVRSVNGVAVSEFEFRDPKFGGANFGFYVLVFDKSFTLVLNGNAKDLIEVEVESLLEQWSREAS